MATRTTLNVSLPVELGRYVEARVASGHYASASEVVRAALRLLIERESQIDRDAYGRAKASEKASEKMSGE